MTEQSEAHKRVLDVGNCVPDHAAIRRLLEGTFAAEVVQTHDLAGTLAELRAGSFDLVLVNRKLDQDYTDGMEIIRRMKADPQLAAVPVMLITNYPEHQQAAVEAGALLGFGKLELASPLTRARLAAALGLAVEPASP
ncbi:MAG: response regulator [Pirellulales bacterium]|nr:response regulator [Pirellulales bacterium]